MKRVALIYTGHLRTWNDNKANHIANIGADIHDCFFYTYENPNFGKQFIQIPDYFHPDPWGEHRYSVRMVKENTVNQCMNQFLNNFVGFRIVPKEYDVYVRVRPDIKFNGPLNFEDHDCTGNNIYIPQGFDFGGICDQFAFGSYEVMKKFYSLYENCHYLWQDGATWHSEGLQLSNLQKEKVNIVRIGYPQIDICR